MENKDTNWGTKSDKLSKLQSESFFWLEIRIHYFLCREFSSSTWKKSPPPKMPILTPKSWLDLSLSYIKILKNGSYPPIGGGGLCPSTVSFLKAHHTKSLGTQSKAFTNSSFSAKYCPCNCFKIKMAFAVPHPGIKTNYILSMLPCCLINLSIILSAIFRIRSVHFIPL